MGENLKVRKFDSRRCYSYKYTLREVLGGLPPAFPSPIGLIAVILCEENMRKTQKKENSTPLQIKALLTPALFKQHELTWVWPCLFDRNVNKNLGHSWVKLNTRMHSGIFLFCFTCVLGKQINCFIFFNLIAWPNITSLLQLFCHYFKYQFFCENSCKFLYFFVSPYVY